MTQEKFNSLRFHKDMKVYHDGRLWELTNIYFPSGTINSNRGKNGIHYKDCEILEWKEVIHLRCSNKLQGTLLRFKGEYAYGLVIKRSGKIIGKESFKVNTFQEAQAEAETIFLQYLNEKK